MNPIRRASSPYASFRRRWLASVGIVAALVGVTACGGSSDAGKADSGTVRISFWHSAAGAAGESLSQQIAAFNAVQQGRIHVEAIYQGTYQASIAKLANAVQSGQTPALMQASDIFTGYMMDSGLTISAQDLSDKYGTYEFEDLAPAVKNYYTVNGQTRSVPYQVSQPVLVANRTVLARAGINADQLPADIAGLIETARNIKQASGTPGLSFFVNTWWNEQFSAAQGLIYCSPDNGVRGSRAESFNYTDSKQIGVWQKLQGLVRDGSMINAGADDKAAVSAFTSNQAGMSMVSSAAIGNIVKTNADFVVRPFPVSADDGGVVPGGNSLWVIGKGKDEAQQKAAWELAKYLGGTENQVKNFKDSGYLPTTLSAAAAVTDPTPAQQELLTQLKESKATIVTAGCHSGALGETRQALQPALESLLGGEDATTILTEQQRKATEIITRYNKRAGRSAQ